MAKNATEQRSDAESRIDWGIIFCVLMLVVDWFGFDLRGGKTRYKWNEYHVGRCFAVGVVCDWYRGDYHYYAI